MIAAILKELSERVSQFMGVVLTGMDGLPIGRIVPPDSRFEQLVIEHIAVQKRLRSLMDSFDFGVPLEFTVVGERLKLIILAVNEDYFLALGVGPDENTGRARYELRRAAIPLRSELS